MGSLKIKVMEHLQEYNISSNFLAKKANIPAATLQNIINSDNANPTIASVLALADAIGCSLDDLVNRNHIYPTKDFDINPALLKSVTSCVCSIKSMEGRRYKEFSQVIKDVYNYCSEQNLSSVDKNFTQWYVKKKFDENNKF
jgi:transcriptional regulator with XRE-family HTH domain